MKTIKVVRAYYQAAKVGSFKAAMSLAAQTATTMASTLIFLWNVIFILNKIFISLLLLAMPAFSFSHQEDDCMRCHGNREIPAELQSNAPLLAQHYSMDWNMYEFRSETRPPL